MVSAIVLLGLCIFVHELGHLIGGVLMGIKVRTFSLGYGKGFIKKKWGETTYQITLIPFGGYCTFYGDNAFEELKGEKWEFLTASPWRRIVVVVMGPLFNLIFGMMLLLGLNLSGLDVETNRIMIPDYLKDYSPALTAGLESGDVVLSIDDKQINSFNEIRTSVAFSDGKPLLFKVDRDGTEQAITITPQQYNTGGQYVIGVEPYGKGVLVGGFYPDDATNLSKAAGLMLQDKIMAVNGVEISDLHSFLDIVQNSAGKELTFKVLRKSNTLELPIVPGQRERLILKDFHDENFPDESYEITAEKISLIRDAIKEGSVTVNGKVPADFDDFVAMVSTDGEPVTVVNKGGTFSGVAEYSKTGFIGIALMSAPEMVTLNYSFGEALYHSVKDPIDVVVLNLKGLSMIFSGKLSAQDNVSGPIRIAKLAGDTMRYYGIKKYILLMAHISIILMFMNLLPIPAVDGSHIVFYFIEGIRKKPLPQKVMEAFQVFGFFLLIGLGVLVMINDLSQLNIFSKLF